MERVAVEASDVAKDEVPLVARAGDDERRRSWTWLESKKRTWIIVVCTLSSILVFAPVIGTPYAADDLYNSTLPSVISKAHLDRWSYISALNASWMHLEGRFFPGAITYLTLVFTTLTTRTSYKIFLFVLLAVVVLTFAAWAQRTAQDLGAALVAVLALVSSWQFRYTVFLDGITSFSGLLPWTLLLVMVTALLFSREPQQRQWLRFALGALVWTITVITYEVSVLLAPALIASLFLEPTSRKWRRAVVAAVIVPCLGEGAISVYLRSIMTTKPGVEFTAHLAPLPVLETTVKQFISVLPLTQYWVPSAPHPQVTLGWWACAGASVLSVVLLWTLWKAWSTTATISARRAWLLAFIGGWVWLAPSLLIGITERWQTDIAWGQGYVSVVFEGAGLAIAVLAALYGLRRCELRLDHPLLAKACAVAIIGGVAVGVAFTGVLNLSLAV